MEKIKNPERERSTQSNTMKQEEILRLGRNKYYKYKCIRKDFLIARCKNCKSSIVSPFEDGYGDLFVECCEKPTHTFISNIFIDRLWKKKSQKPKPPKKEKIFEHFYQPRRRKV